MTPIFKFIVNNFDRLRGNHYKLLIKHDTPESFLTKVMKSEDIMVRASAKKLLGELDVSKPARSGFGQVFETLNWLYFKSVRDSLSYSDFTLSVSAKI